MSLIHIEHEPGSDVKVPGWALASMAGLIAATMLMAWVAVLTDTGFQGTPDPTSQVARSLEIAFHAGTSGELDVVAARDGSAIKSLAAGEGGFLRGVLRPLERERMRLGAPNTDPYRLVQRQDGTLMLQDPTTGMDVDLAAFGKTSVAVFAELLPASS